MRKSYRLNHETSTQAMQLPESVLMPVLSASCTPATPPNLGLGQRRFNLQAGVLRISRVEEAAKDAFYRGKA